MDLVHLQGKITNWSNFYKQQIWKIKHKKKTKTGGGGGFSLWIETENDASKDLIQVPMSSWSWRKSLNLSIP